MGTKIQWTDETWNPTHGCSKVSTGCINCYAERQSNRFGHTDKPWNTAHAAENVQLLPERLEVPLRWRRPRLIFVDSMSDLFHSEVPDNYIDEVMAVILACTVLDNCPHTFQILTKRPERMKEYFTVRTPRELLMAWAKAGDGFIHLDDEDTFFSEVVEAQTSYPDNDPSAEYNPWEHWERLWPLPNLWLGVSTENQEAANERIPLLLKTPAQVRFLSCEPLLGPVDLTMVELSRWEDGGEFLDVLSGEHWMRDGFDKELEGFKSIDWVIVGGESGPGARPMHPEWARSLRDRCKMANVTFFFKQWGAWSPGYAEDGNDLSYALICKAKQADVNDEFHDTKTVFRVGKKAAGRSLDGELWDGIPVSPKNFEVSIL